MRMFSFSLAWKKKKKQEGRKRSGLWLKLSRHFQILVIIDRVHVTDFLIQSYKDCIIMCNCMFGRRLKEPPMIVFCMSLDLQLQDNSPQ